MVRICLEKEEKRTIWKDKEVNNYRRCLGRGK